MREKIFKATKVILFLFIFLILIFWLLMLSSVHRVPTRTYLEAGGTLLALVGLLVSTFYLERKLKEKTR
jgi:archaellum biogenesis protein FlaJ (TadC family)